MGHKHHTHGDSGVGVPGHVHHGHCRVPLLGAALCLAANNSKPPLPSWAACWLSCWASSKQRASAARRLPTYPAAHSGELPLSVLVHRSELPPAAAPWVRGRRGSPAPVVGFPYDEGCVISGVIMALLLPQSFQKVDFATLRSHKLAEIGTSRPPRRSAAPRVREENRRGGAEIGRSSHGNIGHGSKATTSDDVPTASTKRPRDFSLVSPPCPGGGKCLFSYGVSQVEGVESLWDAQDHYLAWKRMCPVISTYDVNRLEAIPDLVIVEAIAGEFTRMSFCRSSYKENLNILEAAEKRSMAEIAQLKEEEEATGRALQEMYEQKRRSGRKFLNQKLGGPLLWRGREGDYSISAFSYFRGSCHAASYVYDDVVRDYRCQLRKSGCMPDEVVMLIDPHIPELEGVTSLRRVTSMLIFWVTMMQKRGYWCYSLDSTRRVEMLADRTWTLF
ncbi:hypothetical protein Pfo_005341 [Paulownia fortunei]|nr:hypothetical protein Pfo_005341 [Paulownia fortunei]